MSVLCRYKPNGEQKTGQSKYRVVKDDEVLSSLERFTPESQGQKVKVESSRTSGSPCDTKKATQ